MMDGTVALDPKAGKFFLTTPFFISFQVDSGRRYSMFEMMFDPDEVMGVWPADEPGTEDVAQAAEEMLQALIDGRLVARVRADA